MKREFREKINNQLKILPLVTPHIYHGITRKYSVEALIATPYWRMIPKYTISRCPICLMVYEQTIDTYTLYLWAIRHSMNSVSYSAKDYQRCEHFVGVHTFLNLNGQKIKKSELDSGSLFSSEPELPMITPTLLPNDIESYAVLHSLPICRIWGDHFLPKYTLYMITYYSTDQKTLEIRRLLKWTGGLTSLLKEGEFWGYANKRLFIYWEEAREQPLAWDLEYWIKKKKLYWLDITQEQLPLANDEKEFPYTNLQGVKHGYLYQNNSYDVVPTKPTIEEYRANLFNRV